MHTTRIAQLFVTAIITTSRLAFAAPLCDGAAGISIGSISQTPTAGAVGDIDGDGREDFAFASRSDSAVYWASSRAGAGYPVVTVTSFGNVAQYPTGIHIADMNNDGRNDIVAVGDVSEAGVPFPGAGRIGWFENNGTPDQAAWPFRLISAGNAQDSVTVDTNGDNYTDLVFLRSGTAFVAKNLGGSGSAWSESVLPLQPTQIMPFDFDGSPETDEILIKLGSSTYPYFFGSLSNGLLGEPISSVGTLKLAGTGDLNHDGRWDIITTDVNNFGVTTHLSHVERPGDFESQFVAGEFISTPVIVTSLDEDQTADISFNNASKSTTLNPGVLLGSASGDFTLCSPNSIVLASTSPGQRPALTLFYNPGSTRALRVLEVGATLPSLEVATITGPFDGPLVAGKQARVRMTYQNQSNVETTPASVSLTVPPDTPATPIGAAEFSIPALQPGESFGLEQPISISTNVTCGGTVGVLVAITGGASIVTDLVTGTMGVVGPTDHRFADTNRVTLPDGTGESVGETITASLPSSGYLRSRLVEVTVETPDRSSIDVDLVLPNFEVVNVFSGLNAEPGPNLSAAVRFEATRGDLVGGVYFFIVTDRSTNSPSVLTSRSVTFESIETDCINVNQDNVLRQLAGIEPYTPAPDTNGDGIVDAADVIEFPE